MIRMIPLRRSAPRALVALGVGALLVSGCVSDPVILEEKDVDYFSLGPVELEKPERRGNVVTIKITLDPRTWHEDAPRKVHHIYPVLIGRKIYFSVTSVDAQGEKVANKVSFPITGVKTGREYRVYYRDPNGASHVIGSVTIPEDPTRGQPRGGVRRVNF